MFTINSFWFQKLFMRLTSLASSDYASKRCKTSVFIKILLEDINIDYLESLLRGSFASTERIPIGSSSAAMMSFLCTSFLWTVIAAVSNKNS